MLAGVLTHLDRERFDPVLVTLFYWEGREYFYDLVPRDVPIHRQNFKGFWDLSEWFKLFALLRVVDPDVVLSNLFFSNTVIRILKPLFRFKVLIVEHNTYIKKSKFHQMIDKLLSRWTARIVAVSNTVAEFTSRQEGIPREKFVVIHNGIDVHGLRTECETYDPEEVKRDLGIPGGSKVLLNIARLTTQKNPRLLVEGFAQFARTHPEYVLVVVGGNPKWDALLKDLAQELGVAGRVYLMGMRKDVTRFYAIADVFVSTSTIEGFGIAHAEALACGVPVLTTKTAGPDEMIVEGENGFFIEEESPEGVARGLEKITQARLVKEKIESSVENYGIEKTTTAYEKLFAEI